MRRTAPGVASPVATIGRWLLLVTLIQSAISAPLASASAAASDVDALRIVTERLPEPGGRVSRGTYCVFENRASGDGRTLDLEVVVLRARSDDPRPDPVVFIAGGPGQNSAGLAMRHAGSWMRQDRDLVFVSQRGTAGNHRLDVELAGTDRDLQTYLDPIFDAERFRRGMEELSQRADLRQYSTANAADDLAEVLAALGYDEVNLNAGSYGTRASLVFMRRHPERVRTAVLMGVAPLAFRNPLYHARAAQQGIERIFEEVEGSPAARIAYPDLRQRFHEVLERLSRQPESVPVRHPATGRREVVRLDRDAFCEAVRVMMYYTDGNRQVPLLLQRAWAGDYRPFAQRAINTNRLLRRSLAFGMLMCVTAAEDVARINPDEVEPLTRDTFLGDRRVRDQMAVGSFWPKSVLPERFGDPVAVERPVLLVSGTHDPVTPPEWGELAHRNLPRSEHVILPGAHGVHHPALDQVVREFLDEASVDDLDLTPLKAVRMPAFPLQM